MGLQTEIAVWRIHRFALRRPPDLHPERSGFTYHRAAPPLLVGFRRSRRSSWWAVDLLVQRWPLVRIPLLVVGIGVAVDARPSLRVLTRPLDGGPGGIRVRVGSGD
ncbi:hypothetical protein QJS66_23390 (plasmid) [Kocuria rhizophila]|nr:hypothetical protein QJS66_23390 [Kocuria rhizophila]